VPEPAARPAQDICPICDGPNDCGLAAGGTTCWCFSTAIPPAALARIPGPARDQSCICPTCAGRTDAARPAAAGS
jgi:hypothetical protein